MLKKKAGVNGKVKHMKRSRTDVIYDGIIFIFLTLIFLVAAYPLYFIVISSISNPEAVAGGKVVFFPVGINFKGYIEVFKNSEVLRGFFNSVLYAVIGTVLNFIVTLPTAYAISRNSFGGKKIVTFFLSDYDVCQR